MAERESRIWRGFENIEAANDRIATIEKNVAPRQPLPCRVFNCNDELGAPLHLTIFKSKDILKASKQADILLRPTLIGPPFHHRDSAQSGVVNPCLASA
jgi:hypothetical protein